MRRLTAIEPVDATGRTRELLDEYAQRGGKPGAMVLTMAQSPTMLRAYMDLSRTMKRSHIDRRIGERISIAVQSWLGCDVCIEAHSDAARALGVPEREIALARLGTSAVPRIAALVAFGQQVHAAPDEVTDDQIEELRDLGFTDEQIAEVPALVALNVLTGTFNLTAGIHLNTTARSAA
jgi:AhpD family alkylhydroperoxidase